MSNVVDTGKYMSTAGERIRKARIFAGLEQKDLAAITGISRGTIINYENDATEPKPAFLAAIALATDFDVNFLRYGVVPQPSTGGDGNVVSIKGTKTSAEQVKPLSLWTLESAAQAA